MTDLLTENARLRAALEPFAMIADLIDEETEGVSTTDEFGLFFLNGESDEPVWFAERFSVQKFKEARAALATPAPDAVQEIVAEAVKAEREACARVCETLGALGGVTPNPRAEWKTHADNLAAAIRARGEG